MSGHTYIRERPRYYDPRNGLIDGHPVEARLAAVQRQWAEDAAPYGSQPPKPARLNGCHNRAPYRKTLAVQDGWTAAPSQPGTRHVRMVTIPFLMESECRYTDTTLGQADAGCTGCRWRSKGPTPA